MGLEKIDAYSLECDGCKTQFESAEGFTIFTDNSYLEMYATDDGWGEKDGKHYCGNCCEISDEDEVVVKIYPLEV